MEKPEQNSNSETEQKIETQVQKTDQNSLATPDQNEPKKIKLTEKSDQKDDTSTIQTQPPPNANTDLIEPSQSQTLIRNSITNQNPNNQSNTNMVSTPVAPPNFNPFITGTNGHNGFNGINGVGFNGHVGLNGPVGPNGPISFSGPAGLNSPVLAGLNGLSGLHGLNGLMIPNSIGNNQPSDCFGNSNINHIHQGSNLNATLSQVLTELKKLNTNNNESYKTLTKSVTDSLPKKVDDNHQKFAQGFTAAFKQASDETRNSISKKIAENSLTGFDKINNKILGATQKIMYGKTAISEFSPGNGKTLLQLAVNVNRHYDKNSPQTGKVQLRDMMSMFDFVYGEGAFRYEVDKMFFNENSNSNNQNGNLDNTHNRNDRYRENEPFDDFPNYQRLTETPYSPPRSPQSYTKRSSVARKPSNETITSQKRMFKNFLDDSDHNTIQAVYNSFQAEKSKSTNELEFEELTWKLKMIEAHKDV